MSRGELYVGDRLRREMPRGENYPGKNVGWGWGIVRGGGGLILPTHGEKITKKQRSVELSQLAQTAQVDMDRYFFYAGA